MEILQEASKSMEILQEASSLWKSYRRLLEEFNRGNTKDYF